MTRTRGPAGAVGTATLGRVISGVFPTGSDAACHAWAADWAHAHRRELALLASQPRGRTWFETETDLRRAEVRVAERRPALETVRLQRRGAPGRGLIEASKDAHLVAVGADQPSRGLRSASRQLSAHARGPVAVVPRQWSPESDAAPVLVAVDGSAQDQWSVELALDHARRAGLPLIMMYAHPAVTPTEARLATDVIERLLDPHRSCYPDTSVQVRIRGMSVARALIEATCSASLLVMGSRGLGRLGRLFGSVGRQVVPWARCPVVIVPWHLAVPGWEREAPRPAYARARAG